MKKGNIQKGNIQKGPPNDGKNNKKNILKNSGLSLSILLIFAAIAMIGVGSAVTVLPNTTINGVIEGGIYNKTVANITLSVTDEGGPGINYTEYRICRNDANFSNTACGNRTIYANTSFDVISEGYRTIKYRSVDIDGNKENWNYINFTIDKTDPNLTIPDNITLEATGILNQVDIGTATVDDNMDLNPIVTNNAPNGGFPIGTTKVTWIATDWAKNTNKSHQYVNVLRPTYPMILNFSAVPNVSINESNPTTISADVIKGVNRTKKVLIGVIDNNNITEANMPVLGVYLNITGFDGHYAAIWQGKLSKVVSSSLNDQVTDFHIDCDTCPENTYVLGIYKKTDIGNESKVYVWINDTGAIINVTYVNYSLLTPKEVNIAGTNSTIRFMRLKWDGTNFVDTYSDISIPIYNVTGANAEFNPKIVKNSVPEGRYKTFVRAEDTLGNYSILYANIDTILPVITPTPTTTTGKGSSGSSSSSGSGGGGGGTSEPYSNILKYQIVDNDITTSPVIYKYTTLNVIYEVVVTGTQNDEASLRIELLKDISKLVSASPPEKVYKNFNMWINSKRINNISIRYKVENSWLDNNSLNQSDIKLYGWKGIQWIYLDTKVLNKDELYTYMESDAGGLSTFAISGIKAERSVADNENKVAVTTAETETPSETTNVPAKSPGFEIFLAIATILILYKRQR